MSNDEAKALIKQRIKETKETSNLAYRDFKYDVGIGMTDGQED